MITNKIEVAKMLMKFYNVEAGTAFKIGDNQSKIDRICEFIELAGSVADAKNLIRAYVKDDPERAKEGAMSGIENIILEITAKKKEEPKVAETDPEFWEKIEKRMPNAYLVMLYWDSEMFARHSSARKELEGENDTDYREKCKDLLFVNTDKYRINHDTRKTLEQWRSLYIKVDGIAEQRHYRRMFEAIINGDPKMRDYRLVRNDIYANYGAKIKNGG